VPPNCRFEIDDLEEDWTWNTKFDFILSRMMLGSFADFPRFVKQAYEYGSAFTCLAPKRTII
jgi:hypothetical protein